MDIHLIDAEPTLDERAAVDAVLGPPASAWEGGVRRPEIDTRVARTGHAERARRNLLLPVLEAVQARAGWISPGAMNYVCMRLDVAPADAYGVATFYSLLSTEPQPPRVVHVCEDIACRCNGALDVIAQLEERFGAAGELSDDGSATWLRSPCLGQCDRGPAAMVTVAGERPEEHVIVHGTAEQVLAALDGEDVGWDPPTDVPQKGDPSLVLLRRVGTVAPTLAGYRASGGYRALRHALEIGPEGVLRELKLSKLQGRGGAAFPTSTKWEAVARQPARPHYLVCNADESEPGTFKDRVILEGDPFALIEAMTVCAVTTGVEQGYIYLRGEYPQAHHALERALGQARNAGFLGTDVMGSGHAFDIEIRKGAGAYICGEETAIFNSIEGERGEPRSKPPFPVVAGLFGKPTIVNNVETLVNVLHVIEANGEEFAGIGTDVSTGQKLFCVSGHVVHPGVYEVPFGTTLREVIALAGGLRPGSELQAVLLGGAAGGFVGPDELDLPLTLEAARAAGTTLGSGVIMVIDRTVDVPDLLVRIAAFFRDESCGQCVPCRVGTVRQEELVERLRHGTPNGSLEQELALFDELSQCMRDASICGLGQAATSAITSAIVRLGVFKGASA